MALKWPCSASICRASDKKVEMFFDFLVFEPETLVQKLVKTPYFDVFSLKDGGIVRSDFEVFFSDTRKSMYPKKFFF